MAVVSVTNDSTRLHDMGDTDGTTGINSIGGGAGAGAEPDFVYQGSNSISRKIGTTFAGFYADTSAFGTPRSVNASLNRNRRLWIAKVIATNKSVLLSVGSPALRLGWGPSNGNYAHAEVAGNRTYPLKGGWVLFPINLCHPGNRSNRQGAPSTINITDTFAIEADFSTTSKSENLAMDAIDVGGGLALVGGTSTDPDGVFQDFVDDDQGDTTNGRFGFWLRELGIYNILGRHFIGRNASGTTTATVFNDSGEILIFPDGLYSGDDVGFLIDLGNASTDIDWNDLILISRGSSRRAFFNTEDINATPDEIQDQGVIDAFNAGDSVLYYKERGTATTGLTDLQRYWVGKDLTATPTGITLHTSRNNALLQSGGGAGSPVALTASTAGNGEIHGLYKYGQSDPVIDVTGTLGAFNITGCSFQNFRQLVLTSGCTITNTTFNSLKNLWQKGATVTGCSFVPNDILNGEPLVYADNLGLISDCDFTSSGKGAAIEITEPGTYSFSGNTFTGYQPTSYAQTFDTENDVTGGATDTITITGHPYSTGDAVAYTDQLASIPRLQNSYSNTGTGTTIDVTGVSIDSDTNALIAGGYLVNTSVQIDPGGANQANFTNLGSSNQWYLPSASVPPSGTYTVRFTYTSGTNRGAFVHTFKGCDGTTPFSTEVDNATDLYMQEVTRRSVQGYSIPISMGGNSHAGILNRSDSLQAAQALGGGANSQTAWSQILRSSGADRVVELGSTHGGSGSHNNNTTMATVPQGAGEDIGLRKEQIYYIRSVDVNTVALYENEGDALNDNNRISLTPSGVGLGETHALQPANPDIINSSGGLVTLNITGGGDVPSIRNVGTSTTEINNAVTVSVTALDDTGGPIENVRVRLEAAPGGDLPSDDVVTITTSGTTATVTHTGHGLETGDFVIIRGANEVELTGRNQITVTDANTYTYTITSIGGAPGTGTIRSTYSILSGLTNVSGVLQTTTFNYTSDQPVRGVARKSTSSPFYKAAPLNGTITSTGASLTATLILDE